PEIKNFWKVIIEQEEGIIITRPGTPHVEIESIELRELVRVNLILGEIIRIRRNKAYRATLIEEETEEYKETEISIRGITQRTAISFGREKGTLNSRVKKYIEEVLLEIKKEEVIIELEKKLKDN